MPDPGKIVNIPLQRIERNISILDYQGIEVPLSLGQLPNSAKEGDKIEVFIDLNEEKEMVATTTMPEVTVGKIARLRVNHLHKGLAFVDVGLEEDLVVPPDQQLFPLRSGQFCHVTMVYDLKKEQLILSTKLNELVNNDHIDLKVNDAVQIDIWMMDDYGSKVIVNKKHWGFLPKLEYIFPIRKGDHLKARIKEIKGKELIISLQEEEKLRLEKAKERILALLNQHNGYVRMNESTPTEEIQIRLRMTKRTFKTAVAMLIKDGIIKQTPRAIKLTKKPEA
ncbi:MAG: S1-like domain-containing RNA-binding protein [Flavobacteriales bacterium]